MEPALVWRGAAGAAGWVERPVAVYGPDQVGENQYNMKGLDVDMLNLIDNVWICGVLIAVACTVTVAASPSFEQFHQRALAGEDLTVAFIGGSLTWGAMATDPQKTSYRAIVGRKLQETYPEAHFKFIDAAIGGSGAQLGAFRLQRDVLNYKPDLVFLDFTLNDGVYGTTPDTLAAHESLVRRIIIEGKCPVIQMFLAARNFVAAGTTDKMKRRTAHLGIAEAYNVPCGDAIILMQELWKEGKLDLDTIWPPESFDMTHPDDPGYALYAEAAWNAFQKAVAEKTVCRVPEEMLFGDRYMHWARIRVSSLRPLPSGWRVSIPRRTYVAFDFLMSRWLDDVTVAANFTEPKRGKYVPAEPAEPLRARFSGSTVLLFGESTPISCRYRVLIDGRPSDKHDRDLPPGEFDAGRLGRAAGGNAHLWQVVAEGLNPDQPHTLEIQPLFEGHDTPGELRIESICIAGGRAELDRNHPSDR